MTDERAARTRGGAIVVMGVSGAGKTTVARLLATQLGTMFLDADDLHPAANVAKMQSGVPLDDEDREPWLHRVREWINAHRRPAGAVVACSALKRSYRDLLRAEAYAVSDSDRTLFVHLDGSASLIAKRLEARQDHYMPADLLPSQFATLEPLQPAEGITVSIDGTPDQIVDEAIRRLRCEGFLTPSGVAT